MKKSYIPIALIAIVVLILLVHVNYLRFVSSNPKFPLRNAGQSGPQALGARDCRHPSKWDLVPMYYAKEGLTTKA